MHGGVREVALKMLLDVEDPEKELDRFTQVPGVCLALCTVKTTTSKIRLPN